jgi:uncharacterized protein
VIVVADTGAMYALLDADETAHSSMVRVFEKHRAGWIVPSATLPELDYLTATRLGAAAQDALLASLAAGTFNIAWHGDEDVASANRIHRRYLSLRLGLVDALIMATAERLNAGAIATLDLRHFGSVSLAGSPRLLPRDFD